MGSNLPCKSGDRMFLDDLLSTTLLTARPVAVDAESPLNPAELQVLRAQYEKEGEMVGVQTKFNYAWVSHNTSEAIPPGSTEDHRCPPGEGQPDNNN